MMSLKDYKLVYITRESSVVFLPLLTLGRSSCILYHFLSNWNDDFQILVSSGIVQEIYTFYCAMLWFLYAQSHIFIGGSMQKVLIMSATAHNQIAVKFNELFHICICCVHFLLNKTLYCLICQEPYFQSGEVCNRSHFTLRSL